MTIWTGLLFMGGFIATPAALAAVTGEAAPQTPRQVVNDFLLKIRTGKHPEQSSRYLASQVQAHQMNSEGETVVVRHPEDYAAHVKDFRRIYGDYDFEITELLSEGDRVYARWKQTGCHIGPVDGQAPSGLPVTEIASAVYRVADGRIAEYWIQIDRKGIESQFESNARNTDHKISCVR